MSTARSLGDDPPAAPIEGRPAGEPAAAHRLRGRTVLLATDLGAAADAAARVVAALATERGAVPHVVSVFDTTGTAVPPSLLRAIAAADEIVGDVAHEEQHREIRARLADAVGASVGWPVRVALGSPARAIAAQARKLGAALVAMGLRAHARVDRVTGDETTLNVVRANVAPVLGVVPSLRGLPRLAVVGFDFGRAAFRAARAVLDVVDAAGRVVLAYAPVGAPGTDPGDEAGARLVSELGAPAAIERAIAELNAPPGVAVDRVLLETPMGAGAAPALLALADRTGADLLAAGSRQAGRLERLLVGGVTSDLVRAGRHSVLVVPPEA